MDPEANNTETDNLEEKGFNAAVDSLVPESTPNPLGESGETDDSNLPPEPQNAGGDESEISDKAADAKAEEIVQEAEKFLGDMTAEEVLEVIGRIDGLEDKVYEKVSTRVFGKFGEIGQQLKALQERKLKIDPEKLTKLKEIDDGIYQALAQDLPNAIEAQDFDTDAVKDDLRKAVLAEVAPQIEIRLLSGLVPNAAKIAKTKDFETWYWDVAPPEVRETFKNWDEGTQMDGVAMAQAFKDYETYQATKAEKVAAKQEAVSKSVETTRSSSAPSARRHMTEDEAFAARTRESSKR